MAQSESWKEGLIVAVHSKGCDVEPAGEPGKRVLVSVRKTLKRGIENVKNVIAVGDQVRYAPEGVDYGLLYEIQPRATKLSRPGAGKEQRHLEQILVANADQLAIVAAIRQPDLHPGVIDRYMIAGIAGGMRILVILNKCDLDPGSVADDAEAMYRPAGVTVIRTDALHGRGIDALRETLLGHRTAFCGHSGVGKSTLLNCLMPEVNIRTGAISTGSRKGTHVTAAAALYRLDTDSWVIDTPGVREFGLWGITTRDLAGYFPEIEPLITSCKYSSCSHVEEADCAVRAAVERGEIHAARYASFLHIRDTMHEEHRAR